MQRAELEIGRRALIKGALAAGVGAVIAGGARPGEAADKPGSKAAPKVAGDDAGATPTTAAGATAAGATAAAATLVPTQSFGRSGLKVSRLALGTVFDTLDSQIVLKRAWDLGVRYWDTADCYEGGRSEKGIGRYLQRNPLHRKGMFLVTASDARDAEGLDRLLNQSLERMHTASIDLLLLHGVKDVAELGKGAREFAEKAKGSGRIRMFGFSTHKNCTPLLAAAARMPWIDGVLASWNPELMKDAKAQDAVQACFDAGIGLTAMKVNRCGPPDEKDKRDQERVIRHIKAGYSLEQARLLAVLADKRIASVALTLKNVGLVEQYVAAALGRPKFRT